jgi:hypothetical protein
MKLPQHIKYKYLFLVLILPLIFNSCTVLKPAAPETTRAQVPNIDQPVSNIEVPVTVDLKNYFIMAENSVPNRYSDNQQPCQGLRYNYTFTRTPFTITGSNNIVNLKFIGSYGFTASYCAKCSALLGSGPQCIVPTVSAQCGVGEPLRRMEIAYQSTLTVISDYHLRSKTILTPVPRPIDRCNVFLGNIDVTDRLISYLSPQLNNLGKMVDDKIAAYNVKPMIDQLWKNIASEYNMDGAGYLNVNPQSVRLSSFNLNGSLLSFSVGLSAKPIVTTISNPQPLRPLPALSTYVPAKGFNIYLDLQENYQHLTTMINQQVVGQTTDVAGKQFVVDSTRVYGIGTKIAIKINFSGSNTGTIYLIGTPVYDAVKHELSFPDLSFDLQTKAWMLKAAKWMFNGRITEMVRKKATYNFTKLLNDNKIRIQKEMSRDMGNNIHSDVVVQDMDIQAIYPTTEKLIVRTLLNGQVKVKVVM